MMRAMYVSSAEVGATVPVGAPGVPHECSMHAHTRQRQAGAVDGTPQVTINRPRQINENSFFRVGSSAPCERCRCRHHGAAGVPGVLCGRSALMHTRQEQRAAWVMWLSS